MGRAEVMKVRRAPSLQGEQEGGLSKGELSA